MPEFNVIWRENNLNGRIEVASGNVFLKQRQDIAAAAGSKVFIYTPENAQYENAAVIELDQEIRSLIMGLPGFTPDNIIIGTSDRILVYGNSQGAVVLFWETSPETNAQFVDLALADLNQDNRQEIIAAAQGKDAIYIYELRGETEAAQRLELFAIRSLPGQAKFVTTVRRPGEEAPVIAVAYDINNESSGIMTLELTPRGFSVLAEKENLPLITALTGGNIISEEGDIAWAGNDQKFRVSSIELTTLYTSDMLPGEISDLAVGSLIDDEGNVLAAGTSDGNLLVYPTPFNTAGPVQIKDAEAPVNDLTITADQRLVVGTTSGEVQVWEDPVETESVIYTVKPGDTLWKIAKLYNVSLQAILSNNNIINHDLIYPGQKIRIPH